MFIPIFPSPVIASFINNPLAGVSYKRLDNICKKYDVQEESILFYHMLPGISSGIQVSGLFLFQKLSSLCKFLHML